jgi:hypothetical protein
MWPSIKTQTIKPEDGLNTYLVILIKPYRKLESFFWRELAKEEGKGGGGEIGKGGGSWSEKKEKDKQIPIIPFVKLRLFSNSVVRNIGVVVRLEFGV